MSEKGEREPVNLIDQLDIPQPFAQMFEILREMGFQVLANVADAELQLSLKWRVEETGVPPVEMLNRKFNELGYLMAPALVQMIKETSIDVVDSGSREMPKTWGEFLATPVDEKEWAKILDNIVTYEGDPNESVNHDC